LLNFQYIEKGLIEKTLI